MYLTQESKEGTFISPSVPAALFANKELHYLNQNIFLIFRSLTEIVGIT